MTSAGIVAARQAGLPPGAGGGRDESTAPGRVRRASGSSPKGFAIRFEWRAGEPGIGAGGQQDCTRTERTGHRATSFRSRRQTRTLALCKL